MQLFTREFGKTPEGSLEWRIPRFAELDAEIQAQAEQPRNTPQCNGKREPRRRSDVGMPAAVRKEITRVARELNRQHRNAFLADPKLKDRASRLLRSMLLPKPRRRGRPERADVTKAITLLKKYRSQHVG